MKLGKLTLALVLFCGVLLSIYPRAEAQEAGLYDAPPPEGTCYIRFLNRSRLQDPNVKLAGVRYSIGTSVLTDYKAVKEGDYQAEINAKLQSVTLKAGKFYTVVVGDETNELKPINLIEDKAVSDPSHSGLYFYNYSGQALDLAVNVNGKSGPVFKGVTSPGANFREVKPFEVAFEILEGGKAVATLPATILARGGGVTIVVTKSASNIVADAVTNVVSR